MTGFADRLIAGTRALGPLCVGIDPHAGRIPDLFGGDTPQGIATWGMAIADAVAGRACIVKPQAGLFERHGPEGMAALQAVIARARANDLLVITDAKRGDIGSTAAGYAQAYLADGAPFESDCLTLNPYMGLDTLEPYIELAEKNGRGVAVLARTSNPGAADFQALNIGNAPLWAEVTRALVTLAPRMMGASGWSNLMLVAGATAPQEARNIRGLAPKCLLLVPGYGTQGAGAREALSGFVAGPEGLEGGVVNASRSVNFPPDAQSASDFKAWSHAIEAAIDAAQADLRAASMAV